MADGKIVIETKLKVDALEKDLRKMKADIEKNAKSMSKSFDLSKVAMAGFATAVVAGAKKAVSALEEMSKAYDYQIKVERVLLTAAKDNPYLSREGVKSLFDYASQMQYLTGISDDVVKQQMGVLATSGRTQKEIADIVRTAADIAATGTMEFEMAVKNLNMSFGGMVGRMGQVAPELKLLTEEQLKAGDAVKLMGEKYRDHAETVHNVNARLSDSWGDLKKAIGGEWQSVTGPVKKIFQGLIDAANETLSKAKELRELKDLAEGKDPTASVLESTRAQLQILEAEIEIANNLLNTFDERYQQTLYSGGATAARFVKIENDERKKKLPLMEEERRQLQSQIKFMEKITGQIQAQNDAKKKAIDKAVAQDELNKQAQKHIDEVLASMNKALEVLRLEADLIGEEVDLQDKLNVVQSHYVSLIAESNGLVSESNQAAIKLRDTYKEIAEEIEATNKTLPELTLEQKIQTEMLQTHRELEQMKHAGLIDNVEMNERILTLYRAQAEELVKGGALAMGGDSKSKLLKQVARLIKDTEKELEPMELVFRDITEASLREIWMGIKLEQYKVLDAVKELTTRIANTIKDGAVFIGKGARAVGGAIASMADFDGKKLIADFKETMEGLERFFFEELPLLPLHANTAFKMIKNFSKTVIKNTPTLIKTFTNVVGGILDLLDEHGPDIIEAGVEIVLSIIKGITKNEGKLVETITTLIKSLVRELLRALPTIILAGAEMFSALIIGFAEMLPEVIREITLNLPAIVDSIMQAIPMIIYALVMATPQIIAAAGELALSLIVGFLQSIARMPQMLWETIVAVVRGIIDGFKRLFGIASPSTVFFDLAGNIIQGLINGLLNFGATIWNAVKSVFTGLWDNIVNVFKGAWNLGKSIVEGICDGISTAWDWVTGTASNVGSTIASAASYAWDWVTGTASNIGSGIASGWNKFTSWLGFDVGTPYINRDQLAMVHQGERIVPKTFNEDLMQGNTIMLAPQALSAMLGGGQKQIVVRGTVPVVVDGREIGRTAFEWVDTFAGGAYGY